MATAVPNDFRKRSIAEVDAPQRCERAELKRGEGARLGISAFLMTQIQNFIRIA